MPTVLDQIARCDKIVGIFQSVLIRHCVQLDLHRMDFHLGEKITSEVTSKRARLSETVLDLMFPHEPARSTLHHYTNLEGLRGIVSSGELRLYPVRKRLGQGGELDAFAKAHDLQGYLDVSKGEAFYKALSDDLFYTSLTRVPPKDHQVMWGGFSKGTGARLEFRVQPKAAQLRPIHYEQSKSTTLLYEINQALRAAGEPPFNPWTISMIGAFYLNSTVSCEDEVRLLVKRHVGMTDLTRSDGKFSYWPIPIGAENDFCDLQLIGVQVAPGGSRQDIETALAGTRFSSISVAGP